MKLTVILISLLSLFYPAFGAEENSHEKLSVAEDGQKNPGPVKLFPGADGIRTIDTGDTVVFDLTGIDNLSTLANVSVSIISDDEVYSLDFSLKYNEFDYLWDTIAIIPPTSVQSVSNYNVNDSTLRFTSNSMNPYLMNTPIVNVGFNILTGSFEPDDLQIVAVYLNGDPCSYKIRSNGTVSIFSVQRSSLLVYPNPAEDMLTLRSKKDATAEIYDLNGKIVHGNIEIFAGIGKEFNVKKLAPGVYFIKIISEGKTDFQKLVIQ